MCWYHLLSHDGTKCTKLITRHYAEQNRHCFPNSIGDKRAFNNEGSDVTA